MAREKRMICKRSANNIYRKLFTLEQLGIKEEQIVVLAVTDRDSKPIKIEGIVELFGKQKTIELDDVTITLYPKDTAWSIGWNKLKKTNYYDWLFWNADNWGK